jgi:hypothetical protein
VVFPVIDSYVGLRLCPQVKSVTKLGGRDSKRIELLPVKQQADVPAIPKSHASLSPRTNLLLVIIWAAAVVSLLLMIQPRLPFTMVLAGGLLGAVAGVLQHLSISQSPGGFITASSLMGVRRAFTSTPWGRKYIAWLYFCKLTIFVIAFVLIRGPLYRVIFGYLVAYASLMLVRDSVTLRDIFALHRLAATHPEIPL